MEIIKRMGQSVINLSIIISLVTLPLLSKGQENKNLTKEQYQVIEGAFRNSGKDHTRIFFQTIDYKSWVHLLYGNYYREERGIGLCSFDDRPIN